MLAPPKASASVFLRSKSRARASTTPMFSSSPSKRDGTRTNARDSPLVPGRLFSAPLFFFRAELRDFVASAFGNLAIRARASGSIEQITEIHGRAEHDVHAAAGLRVVRCDLFDDVVAEPVDEDRKHFHARAVN